MVHSQARERRNSPGWPAGLRISQIRVLGRMAASPGSCGARSNLRKYIHRGKVLTLQPSIPRGRSHPRRAQHNLPRRSQGSEGNINLSGRSLPIHYVTAPAQVRYSTALGSSIQPKSSRRCVSQTHARQGRPAVLLPGPGSLERNPRWRTRRRSPFARRRDELAGRQRSCLIMYALYSRYIIQPARRSTRLHSVGLVRSLAIPYAGAGRPAPTQGHRGHRSSSLAPGQGRTLSSPLHCSMAGSVRCTSSTVP